MATPTDVIRIASSQVGTHETRTNSTKYGAWYGMNHVPWCDIFVSWVFAQANALSAIGGKFALTTAHARWFQAKGRWTQTPQVGALVFYDWGGSKSIANIDHVELVIGVSGSHLTTIGGNTDDAVRQRDRSATAFVVGYGYPFYDGNSTDPEFPVEPVGSSIPGVGQIQELYAVFKALTNPRTWLRVGTVVIGATLMGIGVMEMAK